MRPRLVALDVDGTIVHPLGSTPWQADDSPLPSSRVQQAVDSLTAAGIGVVLASGRMYPGTRRVHEYLGLRSPLVCQQGAAVHQPAGHVIHEFPLDLDVAHEVVAVAREVGHPYEWFTPLRYMVSMENDASEIYAELCGVAAEYASTPEACGLHPTGVGIISNAEEAPGIHERLAARFGDRVHVLDFPSVTVCVAPEATKGRALQRLGADLDIPREAVIAIGDSVNDASMLDWAGRGYAVSHADRYALAAADEVLDMSGDDAVAALLERIAAGEAL